MIHKRILDAAESDSEASIEALASMVSGATSGLVQRVLEDYGDPCVNDAAPPDEPDTKQSMSKSEIGATATGESTPGIDPTDDFGTKQRETLRAIYEHPDASQRQLAELLDVSHSTISHRLNEIENFEWGNRWAIVSKLFDDESSAQNDGMNEVLLERLDQIERRVKNMGGPPSAFAGNPHLTHKIIHACMESENISEDEELQILETAMQGPEQ